MRRQTAVTAFLMTMYVGVSQAADVTASASCPAERLLPQLDAAYHSCNNGYSDGSCEKFVSTFAELAKKYDCRRSFDTGPVPAVWLATQGVLDDFVRLLSQLSLGKRRMFKGTAFNSARRSARAFFASTEFQGVLDGALAEEYLKKSQDAGRTK